MATTTAAPLCYSFGEYTLDVRRGSLVRDGAEVRLRPQSFSTLVYLVERHGRLVTRDELMQAIWGDTIVTDGSLTQCVIDIRKAIGDRSREAIRTVARRGFIFELPVKQWEAPPDARPWERGVPLEPAPRGPARSWPLRVLALSGLVAVAVAVAVSLPYLWPPATPVPAEITGTLTVEAKGPSVAVLPFVDMSEHGNQEYFSDGIAEEILDLLTRIPGLRVTARTSSFSFKGQALDIPEIAQKLDVAYVLEGSVRRSGDHIRVAAHLVDAATNTHLWSQTYDREAGDVLALQADIAASVADSMQVTLAERFTAVKERPAEAYDNYLRGRFFYNRRGSGDLARAAEYFQAALDIDPQYGQAWTGLAGTWIARVGDEGLDPVAGLAGMERAVQQALVLAPEDPATHVRAAQYFGWTGQAAESARHFELLQRLEPDDPVVLAWLAGVASREERLDDAAALLARASRLDPLAFTYHGNLGTVLSAAGRYQEARERFLQALELRPDHTLRFQLRLLDVLQGRYDEALAAMKDWRHGSEREQVLALANYGLGNEAEATAAFLRLESSDEPEARFRVPEVLAWRGDSQAAFERLQTILDDIEARSPRRGWDLREAWEEIHLSPFLAPLRDEPRWQEIREQARNFPRSTLVVDQ